MRIAFFLVYTLGGNTPIYDSRGRVAGRTKMHPFFRAQTIRLPDNHKQRTALLDAVRAASDSMTMPLQHTVLEDTDGKLHEFDADKFDVVPKSGVGIQTQKLDAASRITVVTTPKKPVKAAKKVKRAKAKVPAHKLKANILDSVLAILKSEGPLTAVQIADFIAETEASVHLVIEENPTILNLDKNGFVNTSTVTA